MNDLLFRQLELAVGNLARSQERIGEELVEEMRRLNMLLEQIKKAVTGHE